jgi:prepilin-type N-terminal cleavage/methylation domain-containing protein
MEPARPTLSIDRRPRGFTLAESLVAAVVLAITVVAVSGAIVASQKQTRVQQEDSTAVSLARTLMEEIASRPLSLPDGTAGFPTVTDRSNYDTIDDFSGYTDVVSSRVYLTSSTSSASYSSALPPVTVVAAGPSGVSLQPGQYSRTVTVSYPTSIFGTTVTSGDFGLVTVTVTGAAGSKVTLSRLYGSISVTR